MNDAATLPTLPRGLSLTHPDDDVVAFELVSWRCEHGCRVHLIQKLVNDPDQTEYEIRHAVAVGRKWYEGLPTGCGECGGTVQYEARALL